jgi:hypothetical protein
VGHVLPPAKSPTPGPARRAAAIAGRLDAYQQPVGDHGERLGHGDDDLAGGLLVGEVVAGEPVAGVLVLALGPGLERPVGVGLVGGDEVEAPPGVAALVVDDDGELLASRAGLAQVHPQLAVRHLEGEGAAVRRGRPT